MLELVPDVAKSRSDCLENGDDSANQVLHRLQLRRELVEPSDVVLYRVSERGKQANDDGERHHHATHHHGQSAHVGGSRTKHRGDRSEGVQQALGPGRQGKHAANESNNRTHLLDKLLAGWSPGQVDQVDFQIND